MPNLQDQFIRGASGTRDVGHGEEDQIRSHTHNVTYRTVYTTGGADGALTDPSITSGTGSVGSFGGDETRPKNVAYLICIKAYDVISDPNVLNAVEVVNDISRLQSEKLDKTDIVNVNADTVDGYHAQKTAAADRIPVAGADGKLDAGWINAPNSPSGAQLFTASGAFTVPDGVTAVNVVVQGGGGAGGGATNSGSSGGTSSFGSYISATGGVGGLGAQSSGGVAANGGPSGGYVNRVDGWYNGGPFSDGANWVYNGSVVNNGGRASAHGPGGNAGQNWDSTGSAPSSGYGGGGGAGRKAGSSNSRGHGGGAGGAAAGYVTGLTPGQAIAVTVGAGGTCGGTYPGGAGRAGAVYVWW